MKEWKVPINYLIRMVYEQYWRSRKRKLLSHEERLRESAKSLGLSKEARQRLEWFLYYESKGGRDVSLTCRHFGIGRSLFYKWKKRFDETNLQSLEDGTRSPKHQRVRVSSALLDGRVIALRKRYPAYGKEKIRVLYEREYQEGITSWYIQRVIETYHLQRRKKQRK